MVQPNSKKAPNIVLVEGQRDGGAFLKWEENGCDCDAGEIARTLEELYS